MLLASLSFFFFSWFGECFAYLPFSFFSLPPLEANFLFFWAFSIFGWWWWWWKMISIFFSFQYWNEPLE